MIYCPGRGVDFGVVNGALAAPSTRFFSSSRRSGAQTMLAAINPSTSALRRATWSARLGSTILGSLWVWAGHAAGSAVVALGEPSPCAAATANSSKEAMPLLTIDSHEAAGTLFRKRQKRTRSTDSPSTSATRRYPPALSIIWECVVMLNMCFMHFFLSSALCTAKLDIRVL
jgi:hypothetical protein